MTSSTLLALTVSMSLATLTVLILLVICIPTAWWLAHYQGKAKPFWQTLITLPLVLPPTVLGFYLLLAFAPNAPLGQLWQSLTGTNLAFSFSGILLGSLIYSLPFVMQPLINEFQQVGKTYQQLFETLGVPRWRAFFLLVLPVCRGSLITASTLGFAHTLGEFGLILLIGGNIPGETRVLSVELYNQIMLLDYASAHQSALLLLGFSAISLLLLYWLSPKHQILKV
ncbi:molybdate ABC transporter permease subunit [Opacimonas viscosa]|uniref:Molybdenum transport system permease n=1 Tax=Opacimonas viscosa TaxID=2961944 RepID=A0AA41X1L4_9ALTE|nr:molybdate ABC transporter permease subunit [Opacimonas viscosa]